MQMTRWLSWRGIEEVETLGFLSSLEEILVKRKESFPQYSAMIRNINVKVISEDIMMIIVSFKNGYDCTTAL